MILAISITLDTIWYTRNQVIHKQKSFDIQELIHSIQRRYHAHCAAWDQINKVSLISWVPLSIPAVKINLMHLFSSLGLV